jgi:hypothetical protein
MFSGVDYRHDNVLLHASFEHLQLIAAGARGDFVHGEARETKIFGKVVAFKLWRVMA